MELFAVAVAVVVVVAVTVVDVAAAPAVFKQPFSIQQISKTSVALACSVPKPGLPSAQRRGTVYHC